MSYKSQLITEIFKRYKKISKKHLKLFKNEKLEEFLSALIILEMNNDDEYKRRLIYEIKKRSPIAEATLRKKNKNELEDLLSSLTIEKEPPYKPPKVFSNVKQKSFDDENDEDEEDEDEENEDEEDEDEEDEDHEPDYEKKGISIKDYKKDSILVKGSKTEDKNKQEALKAYGGKYDSKLKGWIFKKNRKSYLIPIFQENWTFVKTVKDGKVFMYGKDKRQKVVHDNF